MSGSWGELELPYLQQPPPPPVPVPVQPPAVVPTQAPAQASTQPPAQPAPEVPPFVPPPAPPPSQAAQVVQDAQGWRNLPALGAALPPPPTTPAAPTGFGDMLTGRSRTQYPDAPEFLQANPGAAQGLKVAAGYLTSAEPAQIADIIRRTIPDAKITHDTSGNPMVQWQGQSYYVNKPGASGADVAKLVADIAAFGGAGRLVNVVRGFVPKLFAGAAVAGATSVAQDTASAALGSEQGIDPGRAVVAAAGGAAAEALMPVIGRVQEVVRRFRNLPQLMGPQGTITATATAILRQAGIDPAAYTQEQLQTILRGAAGAGSRIDAQASRAAAEARGVRGGEFQVPRTAGQASGDQRQLNLEDTLRHGGLGATAQSTMGAFDSQQREALDAAGQGIRTRLSGSATPRDEGTLGEVLRGGIQGAERAADDAVATAYRAAGPLGRDAAQPLAFEISPANSLVGRLRAPLEDVLVDPSTTPQTMAALRHVEQLEEAGGVTLGELETLRRSIGNAAKGNEHTPDGLALIRMRRAVDEWADDSLQRGLYAGDQQALDRVIQARATRAAYGVAFEPRDAPKRVTNLLERALRDNVSGQETFNALYGAGQLGSADGTVAAMRHLRMMFPGDDNPVILAMREGAVQRLFGGTRPAEPSTMLAMAQRMDDALTGKGREVLEGLFSRPELAQLQRYSAEMRDIARLSAKQNNSGTSYKVSQIATQAFRMAVGGAASNAFGFDPAAGAMVGAVTSQMAGNVMGAARATAATAPQSGRMSAAPMSALVEAGLRGGIPAATNQTRPQGLLE